MLPVVAFALLGCSDEQPGGSLRDRRTTVEPDGGAVDAELQTDRGLALDTSPDAPSDGSGDVAPSGDGAVIGCKTSLDVAPLVLDSKYCVLARVDAPAGTTHAYNMTTSELWLYQTSTGSNNFVVKRHPMNLAQNTLGAVSAVFDFKTASAVFAGGYLALPGAGTITAAVGWTQADFSGEIVHGEPAKPPTTTIAKGNFDAAYIDDILLVNGLGLDTSEKGAALYALPASGQAKPVVTGLGKASSYVAVGGDVVYVGGAYGDAFTNRLYAFTAVELKTAIATNLALSTSDDGDQIYEGDVTDVATLGDDLLLIDSSYTSGFKALRRVGAGVTGQQVVKGASGEVITQGATDKAGLAAVMSAGGRIGVVLDDDGKREVIVLGSK